MTDKNHCAKQCEEVLASIIGLGLHFLDTLKFNRKDSQQLYSVCLYVRLLELAVASKALMEKNALVGISILLRSMFEADIDLTNLIKCSDYSNRMYASFLDQKLCAMKEAASPRYNPFLAEIKVHRDTQKDLKDAQSELDKYIKNKKGPINIRCRAELAGKLDEYTTVYSILCLDTHNNIRSLEDWHIEEHGQDEYHAVAFKLEKADLLHCLSAIPGIILAQTQSLAQFLGTPDLQFDAYSTQMEELRQLVIRVSEETKANKALQLT